MAEMMDPSDEFSEPVPDFLKGTSKKTHSLSDPTENTSTKRKLNDGSADSQNIDPKTQQSNANNASTENNSAESPTAKQVCSVPSVSVVSNNLNGANLDTSGDVMTDVEQPQLNLGDFQLLADPAILRIWEFLSVVDLSLCLAVSQRIASVAKSTFGKLVSAEFPKNNDVLYHSDGMLRNFLRFTSNRSLKKIVFSFLDIASIETLLKNNNAVEILFFDWRSFFPSMLNLVSSESLRILSVEYWRLADISKDENSSNDVLAELLRFPNLEALSIQVFDDPEEQQSIQNSFRNARNLRVLDISSPKLFSSAISGVPNTEKICSVGISTVPGSFSQALPGVREVIVYESITSETMVNLQGLPLERLVLMKAESMTPEYFRSMIQTFPSLRYVGICTLPDVQLVIARSVYKSSHGHVVYVSVQPNPRFSEMCRRAQVGLTK